MVEMKGKKEDIAEALMEQSFTITGGTPSKPKSINRMPSKTFSLETPYKGTLFIAYRPESHAILTSTQGNLIGKPSTETDLYRNLNYTSTNTNKIVSSASALK